MGNEKNTEKGFLLCTVPPLSYSPVTLINISNKLTSKCTSKIISDIWAKTLLMHSGLWPNLCVCVCVRGFFFFFVTLIQRSSLSKGLDVYGG